MRYLNFKNITLAAVAAAALLWTAPAQAQEHRVRFEIPFPFVAANQVLPAGSYEVTLDNFSRVIFQSTADATVHAIPLSRRSESRASDRSGALLRFQRLSGTMFLTNAWNPGREDGRAVVPSTRMLEAMRTAPAGAASDTVTLNPTLR